MLWRGYIGIRDHLLPKFRGKAGSFHIHAQDEMVGIIFFDHLMAKLIRPDGKSIGNRLKIAFFCGICRGINSFIKLIELGTKFDRFGCFNILDFAAVGAVYRIELGNIALVAFHKNLSDSNPTSRTGMTRYDAVDPTAHVDKTAKTVIIAEQERIIFVSRTYRLGSFFHEICIVIAENIRPFLLKPQFIGVRKLPNPCGKGKFFVYESVFNIIKIDETAFITAGAGSSCRSAVESKLQVTIKPSINPLFLIETVLFFNGHFAVIAIDVTDPHGYKTMSFRCNKPFPVVDFLQMKKSGFFAFY